jgi:hypothetical protein
VTRLPTLAPIRAAPGVFFAGVADATTAAEPIVWDVASTVIETGCDWCPARTNVRAPVKCSQLGAAVGTVHFGPLGVSPATDMVIAIGDAPGLLTLTVA